MSLRPTIDFLSGNVITTDATVTTIITVPIPDPDSMVAVLSVIMGQKGDGSVSNSYLVFGHMKRDEGGAVEAIAEAVVSEREEDIDWRVEYAPSGNDLLVRVIGEDATIVSWHAFAFALIGNA